jgi:hypothetical protein
MSALPPKADIAGRQLNVRFVPVADMARQFQPCPRMDATNTGTARGSGHRNIQNTTHYTAPVPDRFKSFDATDRGSGLRDRHRQALDRTEARARTPSDLLLGNRERKLRPAA